MGDVLHSILMSLSQYFTTRWENQHEAGCEKGMRHAETFIGAWV